MANVRIDQIGTQHTGAVDDTMRVEMQAADLSGRWGRPSVLLNQPAATLTAAAAALSGALTAGGAITFGADADIQHKFKQDNDSLLAIYSDGASTVVMEAAQASNGVNKYTLALQKYGGGVSVNGGLTCSGSVNSLASETSGATFSAAAALSASHASYASSIAVCNVHRAASSDFTLFAGWSGNFGDAQFNLRGDGEAFCDGSWTGGGADYAEYFETIDGKPIEPGVSVVLEGTKVRPATHEDHAALIIGPVSVNPTVTGDAAWNFWSGKYLTDDFGAYLMEDYDVLEWAEPQWGERRLQSTVAGPDGRPAVKVERVEIEPRLHSYAADAVPEGIVVPKDAKRTTQQRRKLNPKFDPNHEYVPREKRPEWVTIGLMGKLRLRKGQPVGERWIKMRDISDTVEEWLVR